MRTCQAGQAPPGERILILDFNQQSEKGRLLSASDGPADHADYVLYKPQNLKMNIDLKEDFNIIEEGAQYELPQYEVVDGKGIERVPGPGVVVSFVRGSKLKGEDVPKQSGTLHEHLLAMMVHDLQYKNGLVPSREGALVITKLQEALGWLRQRQIDRTKRDVVGTYKE